MRVIAIRDAFVLSETYRQLVVSTRKRRYGSPARELRSNRNRDDAENYALRADKAMRISNALSKRVPPSRRDGVTKVRSGRFDVTPNRVHFRRALLDFGFGFLLVPLWAFRTVLVPSRQHLFSSCYSVGRERFDFRCFSVPSRTSRQPGPSKNLQLFSRQQLACY